MYGKYNLDAEKWAAFLVFNDYKNNGKQYTHACWMGDTKHNNAGEWRSK